MKHIITRSIIIFILMFILLLAYMKGLKNELKEIINYFIFLYISIDSTITLLEKYSNKNIIKDIKRIIKLNIINLILLTISFISLCFLLKLNLYYYSIYFIILFFLNIISKVLLFYNYNNYQLIDLLIEIIIDIIYIIGIKFINTSIMLIIVTFIYIFILCIFYRKYSKIIINK